MGDWQDISTAPMGTLLLYFSADRVNFLPPMVRVDVFPVYYPRKPTHWMPLPLPPKEAADG